MQKFFGRPPTKLRGTGRCSRIQACGPWPPLFEVHFPTRFDARHDKLRDELEAEGISGDQTCFPCWKGRDEYTAENVFWVPPEARWTHLAEPGSAAGHRHTHRRCNPRRGNEDNPEKLKGKLSRDYARKGIEPEKMKGLVNKIAEIGFKDEQARARDMLGRVYEYFLGKFAQAEGKRGGEFFTPRSIVRLLVEMIEPYEGRVYDPCCGSAGMFVQSESFVEAHGGQKTNISIFGQESNPTTWRLAHMNLAIRGIEANLGSQPADSFLRDLHLDLKADYILANPPFNDSDWSGELLQDDVRWRYGPPPTGNANYAWIQHFIHHLASPNGHGGGVAGFVMANGSLTTSSGGEGGIRQRIIEDDLVDAIVALPTQLFLTTGISACLWFLTRDKSGRNLNSGGRDRTKETLFIDAGKLGTMETNTLRVLTGGEDDENLLSDGMGDPDHDSDIGRIVYAFRQWRGEPPPAWWDEAEHGEWAYRDIPGFCKAETIEGIKKQGFVLVPGRYVGTESREDDGERFMEKYPRLLRDLEDSFAEGEQMAAEVRKHLDGLRYHA